jgi:hypothetical protein
MCQACTFCLIIQMIFKVFNKVVTNEIILSYQSVDPYIHSPICLHGVVFNKLSTGTNLPYILSESISSIPFLIFLCFAFIVY